MSTDLAVFLLCYIASGACALIATVIATEREEWWDSGTPTMQAFAVAIWPVIVVMLILSRR